MSPMSRKASVPTTAPRRAYHHEKSSPLESFDPRLFDVWLRATRVQLTFEFPALREAKEFRRRLQVFRARYIERYPETATTLRRAETRLEVYAEQGVVKLILLPTTDRFDSILSQFEQQSAVLDEALEKQREHQIRSLHELGGTEAPPPKAPGEVDPNAPPPSVDELLADFIGLGPDGPVEPKK